MSYNVPYNGDCFNSSPCSAVLFLYINNVDCYHTRTKFIGFYLSVVKLLRCMNAIQQKNSLQQKLSLIYYWADETRVE